ncbi:uncharacterized protein [Littorina saxatilis]|uniref:uncharacterized protein n=1 Tax=Littorina saxatilis TaxID=31220 RepID=UPI0038B6047D
MEKQDSDTDRSDDGVDTEDQNQGEVYRDQGLFLNNILPSFLDNVQPIESGLVDIFIAEGVFSSDEEHIIMKRTTRRGKARKTWKLLKRVPPTQFQNSCYPAIKDKYPHVLEGKEFQWDGKEKKECLRHVIMNAMRLNRFGDLFPPFNGCTEEEYSILTENGDLDHRWALAFSLCAKPANASNPDFVQKLRQMIEKKDVSIPDNFSEILVKGLPCTCQPRPTTSEATFKVQHRTGLVQSTTEGKKGKACKRNLQVQSPASDYTASKVPRLTASPYPDTSCGYPSSLDDTDDDRDSVSISSRETTLLTHKQFLEEEDITFETNADKDRFLRELEKVNGALANTSHVRLLYRQLLDIRDEMKILAEGTITSGSTVSTALADWRKALSHGKRLVDIKQLLREKWPEVQEIKEAIKDVTWLKCASCSVRTLYLAQRQRLIGEVKEVEAMLRSSPNIHNVYSRQLANIMGTCARYDPVFKRNMIEKMQKAVQSTKSPVTRKEIISYIEFLQNGSMKLTA